MLEIGKSACNSLATTQSSIYIATNHYLKQYNLSTQTMTDLPILNADNLSIMDDFLVFNINCHLYRMNTLTNRIELLFTSGSDINAIDSRNDFVGLATDEGIPLILNLQSVKRQDYPINEIATLVPKLTTVKIFRKPGHFMASTLKFLSNNCCITGGYDSMLKLWDIHRGTCRDTFVIEGTLVNPPYIESITDISTKKEMKVAVGFQNGGINIYSIKNWKIVLESMSEPHFWAVSALCYDRERDLMISGSIDKRLLIGDMVIDVGYKINAVCVNGDLVYVGGTVNDDGKGAVSIYTL